MSKTQKTQRLARVALTSFVGQDADGNYVAWPRGSAAISSLRALARRGAATAYLKREEKLHLSLTGEHAVPCEPKDRPWLQCYDVMARKGAPQTWLANGRILERRPR